jgi:hypothetical protein
MSDSISDRSAAHQTNVAGDWVGRDNLTVTGDRNVVTVHNLVQGVHRLPTDYATRIENFLVEYLGTPDHPVPFGGREAALTELDAWLIDPTAPPYMLLTAPAGRGKSALLTRWSQGLTQREDAPAVVFLPVSVRFRTNLNSVVFASLAARLANLHGVKVPITSESAEIWRGMVSSYLARPLPDGRSLLVILDGVDEAADWDVGPDLFFLNPPDGLRMVVSARLTAQRPTEDAWRQTLGWERPDLARALDLPLLDRPGIADVLARMGGALDELTCDRDFTAELYHLSAGDPLLVRLYVEALRARGEKVNRLRLKDLHEIELGPKGYLDRWWADQHDLLEDFKAKARFSRRVPAYLIRHYGTYLKQSQTPDSSLYALVSEGWLRAWEALPEGACDGFMADIKRAWLRAEANHDLAMQVKCALCRASIAALSTNLPSELPILAVKSHIWSPRQALFAIKQMPHDTKPVCVPGIRAFWPHDRKRADALARLAPLLPQDLLIEALHIVRSLKAPDWCAMTLLALLPYLSSDAKRETINELQGLMRDIEDTSVRVWVMTRLASYLTAKQRDKTLKEALTISRAIKDEEQRALTLSGLLSRLPRDGLDAVLLLSQDIKSAELRAMTLIDLLPYLPLRKRDKVISEIQVAMSAGDDTDFQLRVLAALIARLPSGQLRDNLIEMLPPVQIFENKEDLTGTLDELMQSLPWAQLTEEVIAAGFDEEAWCTRIKTIIPSEEREVTVLEVWRLLKDLQWPGRLEQLEELWDVAIERGDFRTDVLIDIAPNLSKERLTEEVDRVQMIESKSSRAYILTKLMPALPLEQREELLTDARAIKDKEEVARSLSGLAPYLPEHCASMWWDAHTIEDDEMRARLLVGLAPYMPLKQREKALSEALTALRFIKDENERTSALVDLATSRLSLDLSRKILDAIHMIEKGFYRAQALSALAGHLPVDLLTEALDIARETREEFYRAEMLTSLAPHLSTTDLLTEALADIHAMHYGEERSVALFGICPYLPEELLNKALETACSIPVENERAIVLSALAPRLSQDVLAEVLSAVPKIWRAEARILVLTRIVPYLLPELLDKALSVARQIGVKAMIGFIQYLPPRKKEEFLTDALEIARNLENDYSQAEVWSLFPSHVSPDQRVKVLKAALDAIQTIENEYMRAETLTKLAEHLPSNLLIGALDVACAIKDETSRAEALAGLASTPYLPPNLLVEMLHIASAIESKENRIKVLVALAPRLASSACSIPKQAYDAACTVLRERAVRPRPVFLEDLYALMPFLMSLVPEESRQQVATEIYHAIQDVSTWWP